MRALEGKVAIISGSGRGIGRATALKLAGHGASLVINDLDEAPAAEVVAEIRAGGGKAESCVGDVTAPDFGDRFVETALSGFGGLDIIVNNAGYPRDGVIQKQTDEQFQEMLDVHVLASFRILRAATEPIRALFKAEAGEGRQRIRKVVNVSSMAGTHGNATQISYSAAKSALVGMTKSLSKEWGRYRVCVNCVAFGIVETRLTVSDSEIIVGGRPVRGGIPEAEMENFRSLIPLGRPGTPQDAANSIYMLCSPDSDYVSGHVLIASGGMSI